MRIYLLRHGEAGDAQPDEDRRLTPEGRRKLGLVLGRARQAGAAPSLILSSPFVRALETAELAREILAGAAEIRQSKALVPYADPAEAWEEIRLARDAAEVLLAAHEPLLGRLAAHLLGVADAEIEMRKAALARIDLERFGAQPRGALKWLLPPELA